MIFDVEFNSVHTFNFFHGLFSVMQQGIDDYNNDNKIRSLQS